LAALGSIILSAAVSVHCSAALTPYIHISQHEPWNRFLAMFLLFAATSAAIWLLFHLVSGLINRLKLKEFDHQLGALFGLLKGILFCVVITFFAVTLSESARRLVLQSNSGDLIARGIRDAAPILPDDVRHWLGKYIDELDEKLHAPLQEESPAQIAPAANDKGRGGRGISPPISKTSNSRTSTSKTPSPPVKNLTRDLERRPSERVRPE